MQLPVKAHYATLAMLALAEVYESQGLMPARAIAQDQDIPAQFLGQILQQLRSAGLIASTRGAGGGFHLRKSPDAITVGEIVDTVCPAPAPAAIARTSRLCEVVGEVWEELQLRQRELLDQITLADLLSRAHPATTSMFYI